MKNEIETREKKYKITIDPRLDKYDNVILFPEKVEEAKRTIERIGLPGDKKKNHQ